ncbi:MAG: T9SS type A sorting domain-containing protein [Lewinellaceae bacterium]|nr:T9SS type A sorting domain-containing protein [Phaeodactylibacter sp.]MCB9036951.1 T9SS type A sorting domain-containing protein [Lewinellaceae bacterium]
MKFRMLYSLFALIGAALLLMNNSTGPASVQGLDRTGSPLSPGPCQACHSAGAFSPTLTLEVLDDGAAVDAYEPGKTYRLRVEAGATGSPAGYGFQAVALMGNNDDQAGAFSNPGAGIKVTPLNGRQYAEHSMRRTSNIFEVDWTAPEAGAGEVRFYSAVVAANGNGSSGGDGSSFLTSPVALAEGAVSSTEGNELFETFSVFPNPVGAELHLRFQSREQGAYQLRILDLQGQSLLERRIEVAAGRQLQSLDASALPTGLYTVQVADGRRVSSRKVVKR